MMGPETRNRQLPAFAYKYIIAGFQPGFQDWMHVAGGLRIIRALLNTRKPCAFVCQIFLTSNWTILPNACLPPPSNESSSWISGPSGVRVLWPRKADQPDELVEFASPTLSAAEDCERHDLAEKVKRCIQGLPFLQKEALILREYERMSYEEIAVVLNKSLGTIKTLIHRALENLQNRLLSLAEEIKGG